MKKLFTLFVFSILSFSSYSQNPFTLTKSVSFGLNNHTNRDYPNFSFVDKEKNLIIIGTTERDSTFSDVLVTKLDENYDLIWQKTTSFSTSLSYEIPLKAFTNTNGDIYVFGASKTNATKIYGKLFYIKYDENGNELFKKIIENKDGSEYHDFGYFDVKLNSDDTINLVYSPHTYSGYGSNEFHFLKIDAKGNATQLFTKEIINQGIRGKIENDTFYFVSRKFKNPDNTNEGYSHTFLKIDKEGNENSLSIENTDFHKYYLSNNYENFNLDIDGDKNSYLTTLNSSDNDTKGRINISLISSDNILKFVLTTSIDKNYYLIDSFINSTNQLVIIANDLDTEKLVFLSIDSNNQIITLKENNSYLGTGFKLNKDGTFFITTSNSNIRLFSDELIEISSFNNSNTYNLVDFSKVDNNTIISLGVEVNKMFPQSDFNTQLNIISEKINTTNILNKYTFSGEGTSNVFQHKTYIDNDNNYILFVTEKLGPLCYYIGCSQPPLSVRVVKYNSDLKKLWEYDFIGQVSNIESYYSDNNLIIDSNNNIYLNLLNKERDKNHLYKLSSEGILLYKKESVKSKEIVINENTNKVYIISGNKQFIDQTTWKTSNWSEIKVFNLTNGNLEKDYKYDNRQYLNHFFNNGSLFTYFLHLNSDFEYLKDHYIYLYNEDELIFRRKLDLKESSIINQISLINKNGSLLINSSHHNYQSENRFHKINLNNEYSFKQINERLFMLLNLNNKIIAQDDDRYINVYNENLELIKKGNIQFPSSGGFVMSTIKDKIFVQWFNPNENNSAFFNDNLEIEHQFKFDILDKETFSIDKENNLITVNTFGNGIYLKPWVSWKRGLVSKYNLDTTLSIENFTHNSNNQINIYPNPTKNIFTINLSNNRFNKVEVYSTNGQLINIYQKKEIDISNFKTGLYILKVFTKEKNILYSKIIKQ
jgi:hypothetical protein